MSLHHAPRITLWITVLLFLVSGALLPDTSRTASADVGQEIIARRTARSRTFLRTDGSEELRIYPERIAYPAPDGSMQLIDSTLVSDPVHGDWRPRVNNLELRFAQRLPSLTAAQVDDAIPLVSLARGQQSIALQLLNMLSARGHAEGSAIHYRRVAPGMDVSSVAGADQVREMLIFERPPDRTAFTFRLAVDGGRAELISGGAVRVTPCEPDCLTILPPSMQDARGRVSEGVQVRLEARGPGQYLLTYEPDAAWLAQPERAFPVVLDSSVTAGSSTSLYVQERYPTTSTCNSQRMIAVGYDPASDLGGYGKLRTRAFVAVDLPPLPAGSIINGATLNAWLYYLPPGASGYTANVHRVTAEWVSRCTSITWNNQPSIDAAVQASRHLDTAIGWKNWDITGLVQQWYNGVPNYGLALFGSPETQVGSFFCSSVATGTQCGTGSDQHHPYISITYTTPPPPAQHTDTRLRGIAEADQTTILLQVCGKGSNYRFRSARGDGTVLWDKTYDTIDGCSPEYKAVVGANPGDTFRFYSTVMNGPLSDTDFLALARRDACIIDSSGAIRCQPGDTPPTPLPPASRIIVSQQQGFDTCAAPSEAAMRTWRASSPYQDIGIYIGGSSRGCRQPNLTPAWVNQVLQQGWRLIPIWVGPQAPCTGFHSRLSQDPATARGQGAHEADLALAAAVALNLADSSGAGTIIYYDMENYNTRDVSCREAVKAFIGGWSSRLHERGSKAGAYGSACASAVSDWASAQDAPDAAWIAAWYSVYAYRPVVPVTNLPCVSNALWSQHQRIRQYAGGHIESWGNLRINIDSNQADGLVVGRAPAQAANLQTDLQAQRFPQNEPTIATSTITQMRLVSTSAGWALVNGQLLWTTNGGASWINITPPTTAPLAIRAVMFINSTQGWLVAEMPTSIGNGIQLAGFRTGDGGRTWQSARIADFAPDAGQTPPRDVMLTMLDHQIGWVALQLATGSNFSQGMLFKTGNGGLTWQQLILPSGGPVRFISQTNGWVIGGPAGDELYVTRDGGQTWTKQALVTPGEGEILMYDLPTFWDALNGVIPVTRGGTTQPRVEFYSTSNGGQTWTLRDSLPLSHDVAAGANVPIAVLDADHRVVGGAANTTPLPPNTVALSFVSATNGWARTSGGDCTTGNCTARTSLYQTTDGGRTWRLLQPQMYPIYLPLLQR